MPCAGRLRRREATLQANHAPHGQGWRWCREGCSLWAARTRGGPFTCSSRPHRPRHRHGPRTHKEAILSSFLLRLYVTGKTPRAEQAIANLRRICEEELKGQYELQIIDVLEHPQLADDEKILATPTLIKRLPPPLRRVIGDLSDKEKVLLGLDVWPDTPTTSEIDTP